MLLLAAGLVVVAAAATTTTRAAWRHGEPIDAGSIRAGELSLLVGADGTADQTFELAALSGTNLGPGSIRQAPLTVTNGGAVALRYRRSGVDPGALDGHVELTSNRVATESACPATGAPTALEGDMTVPRTLAPGQAEIWCLRVTFGTDPPQGLVDEPFSIDIAAEQDRHAD